MGEAEGRKGHHGLPTRQWSEQCLRRQDIQGIRQGEHWQGEGESLSTCRWHLGYWFQDSRFHRQEHGICRERHSPMQERYHLFTQPARQWWTRLCYQGTADQGCQWKIRVGRNRFQFPNDSAEYISIKPYYWGNPFGYGCRANSPDASTCGASLGRADFSRRTQSGGRVHLSPTLLLLGSGCGQETIGTQECQAR